MKSKSILNIAHRGFSSLYPENTMQAFEQAFKVGADGIECDLRLTADGHIVIFHDDDLKRLCGCVGSIEKMTLAEVKNLRVKGTEKIPSLDEVLDSFHTNTLNLEIKPSSRNVVVTENVLRVLTKSRPKGRIVISSFDPEVLETLHLMDPERRICELGILVETPHLSLLPEASKKLSAQTWNVPKQILNAPWIDRWKGEPICPLWVWTMDEPDQWRATVTSKLPVEAIITNKPDALKAFLAGTN